jgi:hypothetical protein
VRYSIYIDQAIESCFNIEKDLCLEIIVSVNNESLDGYEISKYFDHPQVVWRCIKSKIQPMEKSWNFAIDFASKNWIFLLSDDDLIGSEFLNDIDIEHLKEDSLYLTRSMIINENSDIVGRCLSPPKKFYKRKEILDLYFAHRIQNHLSLMVFHKNLFNKIKEFTYCGYPSGMYIDTVFHGKAFANCTNVYVAKKTVFYRRQSSFQQSASFYSDSKVNMYFETLADTYMRDDKFSETVISRYKSKNKFKDYIVKLRFLDDWVKLHNPIYKKNLFYKIKYLLNFIFLWKLNFNNKIFCIFFVFYFPVRSSVKYILKYKVRKNEFRGQKVN